jgi:hypothetical protein
VEETMKRVTILVVVLLPLGACGSSRDRTYEITVPPEVLTTAKDTTLLVPKSCPVYAPGGGDVDTPEDPFPANVEMLCGVDAGGGTYGLVGGDAPTSRLAVLPGSQELGLYIGIKASAHFTPDKAVLAGETPGIKAWAAPTNVYSQTSCCAEMEPNSSLQLQMIAIGARGMMISLGTFDASPTQVAFSIDPAALFNPDLATGLGWMGRFYVNGAP